MERLTRLRLWITILGLLVTQYFQKVSTQEYLYIEESAVFVAKCPLCSGSISKKDVSLTLERLRLARSPRILEIIDSVMMSLSKHWAIHDVDVAGFLADIENIDDSIITESVYKFKKKGGIEQGFNIRYLAGIIKNESKRVSLRQEYEKRTLDRIPPKLED